MVAQLRVSTNITSVIRTTHITRDETVIHDKIFIHTVHVNHNQYIIQCDLDIHDRYRYVIRAQYIM